MDYLVFDFETTIEGPEKAANRASPFWKDNVAVMGGFMTESSKDVYVNKFERGKEYKPTDAVPAPMLVGHNVKFDLLHRRKLMGSQQQPVVQPIWDTQLADYLLSGQVNTWSSLNDISERMGLPVKDNTVTDLFEKGFGADKIDPDTLIPYLKQDVRNTTHIFIEQWEAANTLGMVPLILSQMDALLATTEMEWNGMAIDQKELAKYNDWLTNKISKLSRHMEEYAEMAIGHSTGFNFNSDKQLGTLLWGGVLEYEVRTPSGVYKTGVRKGMTKYAIKKEKTTLSPVVSLPPAKTPTGKIQVSEDILKQILAAKAGGTRTLVFVHDLLEYRTLTKQKSTYVDGLFDSLYDDDMLHPNINHTATRTGRLSSTNPNAQNITNGPVKKAFVSRWGDDGMLMEFDYGQLEVYGLAIRSADTKLILDLKTGVDIHSALYMDMHGRLPNEKERKDFKPLTFGLIYGAGYKTLAKNAKCSENDAIRFIDAFYSRYPGVLSYHTSMISIVQRQRVPSTRESKSGYPLGVSTHVCEWTGRRYTFYEYESDIKWHRGGTKKRYSFSPTEIKNYPIQGLATADIVPLMLGVVFKILMHSNELKDKCLMIGTTHDSMLFDCRKEVLDKAYKTISLVLKNTPLYFKNTFGKELPFEELVIECKVGYNWYEMNKYTGE